MHRFERLFPIHDGILMTQMCAEYCSYKHSFQTEEKHSILLTHQCLFSIYDLHSQVYVNCINKFYRYPECQIDATVNENKFQYLSGEIRNYVLLRFDLCRGIGK